MTHDQGNVLTSVTQPTALDKEHFELTQVAFANVLGVSPKTVEAWERGRNRPDGPARRMMGLLREDSRFAEKHGFVVMG